MPKLNFITLQDTAKDVQEKAGKIHLNDFATSMD